jgi:DNA replication protein DnaC
MIGHPSTPECAERIITAEALPLMVPDRHCSIDVPNPRRERELAFALRSYDIAIQCDEIQATRLDGCWCYGSGGTGLTFCECPEGEAALRIGEAEHAAWLAARRAALWDESGVPLRFQSFTLDNFPSKPALASVRAWQKDGGESLLLWGAFGTGKTALAVGLVRERIDRGERAYFTTSPKLLDRIKATYSGDGAEDEILTLIKTVPFLVLDDLGAERVTDWVEEKLFTIINERHDEMRVTVFTTNLSPAELGAHIGERTAWRVMEMCDVLKIDGANLRAPR